MNLFLFTFIVEGDAASYAKSVIVHAKNESEAKQKLKCRFGEVVEFTRVVEVLAKYETDIFGVPLSKFAK